MNQNEVPLDRIRRALANQNPWWSAGKVPSPLLCPYRRRDFYPLRDKLSDERILVITGPRRAGKTTVMYQMIDELLSAKKVEPRRVLFVSFDYPYLLADLDRPFEDILRAYTETILKESLENLTERVYIFLDEVYSLPEWGKVMKGHFDRRTNTKVILSGSSSPEIIAEAARSLVGRIDRHLMLQMKFVDVVCHDLNKDSDRIKEASLGLMRKGFEDFLSKGSIKSLWRTYNDAFNALANLEDEIQGILLDYLVKDGYPENLGVTDFTKCAQAIVTSVDLSIYKDVMRVFKNREPQKIEKLMAVLSQSSGNIVASNTLSDTLGLNFRTVERYLSHLEAVYLVSVSYAYSGSLYKSLPKARKIYVANVGVRNAILGLLNERLPENSVELGRCAEAVAHDHIKRLAFCMQPTREPRMYYWRDRSGNEVDIIVDMRRMGIPFDVRFRETIDKGDLKALNLFLAENPGCKCGILLTKRRLGVDGKVLMIPLWLFLLTC
ncbi:MAG: ATP-binding protein [Candidatus Thermoplasmatota archaeon]|nr:ATP-binding protein [Candidatus Thermoplasmatota archaeon]